MTADDAFVVHFRMRYGAVGSPAEHLGRPGAADRR